MGSSGSKSEAVRRHEYKSGNVYEGAWKRNQRHGRGRLTWPDGTVYDGEWVQDKQQGEGRYQFTNGNVYEGEFHNSNICGHGALRTTNGEIVRGIWTFLGRARSDLNGYQSQVGTYNLDAVVTDLAADRSVHYKGRASLHLDSGLLVLPNMQSPGAVMPFAEALPMSDQVSDAPVMAVAQPAAAPGDAAVVVAQAVAESGASLQQQPQQQQPQDAVAAVQQGLPAGSVAYGVHDSALETQDKRNAKRDKPVEVLDVRNYF